MRNFFFFTLKELFNTDTFLTSKTLTPIASLSSKSSLDKTANWKYLAQVVGVGGIGFVVGEKWENYVAHLTLHKLVYD